RAWHGEPTRPGQGPPGATRRVPRPYSDGMTHVPLGRSGLLVSRGCLGAMTFGQTSDDHSATDEKEARRIVDAFLDAGHNFIDTADVYAGGNSEEIVGRAIAKRRDQVVLATKG